MTLPGYFTGEELRGFGFRSLGTNVLLHRQVNLVGPEHISIGSNVRIDAFASLIATGPLELGSYIHIGSYSYLSSPEGLSMADFSGLSQGVKIYTRSDDYSGNSLTNPLVPERYKRVTRGAVRLGRHVIIGAGSVILPGCVLGDGVAVGALSLVQKSLPEWGVYFGAPARRIKARSQKLLELEAELLQAAATPKTA